jgi:hypothetical protein
MSDPTPYSYNPDNGQGPYGTSNSSWPNNGASPYTDPAYPNAGSAPYPPPQPNTNYAQSGNYAGQSYFPPTAQEMYSPPPQPAYTPYAGYRPAQSNGPGIASLVLGIIGVITFWFPFVGFPISIVGLVLAAVGMKRLDGKGIAIAGLVLSLIGVVLGGCIAAVSIAALHNTY